MLLELWPFANFGHLMLLLYCAKHKFRIMYANVLKFHIYGFLMKNIGDLYFFLSELAPILGLFTFNKIILKSLIFLLLLPSCSSSVGVKQC